MINTTSMSNVKKFSYLLTYLEGTAARAISGFTLNEENYTLAVEILKERFGRKDVLVLAHINKITNLPIVERSSDLQALRIL